MGTVVALKSVDIVNNGVQCDWRYVVQNQSRPKLSLTVMLCCAIGEGSAQYFIIGGIKTLDASGGVSGRFTEDKGKAEENGTTKTKTKLYING